MQPTVLPDLVLASTAAKRSGQKIAASCFGYRTGRVKVERVEIERTSQKFRARRERSREWSLLTSTSDPSLDEGDDEMAKC